MIAALSLILVLSISAVSGTSNADPNIIYTCDATNKLFGCDPAFWLGGSRLRCANKTNIMSWASKPVRSDCYSVYAGNDEKNPVVEYVPDSYIPIHVDVKCYYKKFRGILLYAVNSTEGKVGEWFLPDDDPAWFKQPWGDIPGHECEKALMHASADFKPYRNTIRFKAPPAGTGAIKFRCLIKQGNANAGAFYWPNVKGDISLKEGKASPSAIDWQLTAQGQSCASYCAPTGKVCDSAALKTLSSQSSFDKQISSTHPCKLPYLQTNDSFAGSFDAEEGFCYYADSSSNSHLSCSNSNPEVSKFCACGDFLDDAPSLRSGPLFLLGLFLVSPRSALIATIFYMAVSGHNWINNLSRSKTASAYAPCKPPLTELPHAQVGPNQAFQIEWMNGHGSFTYFAILHSKDADKMKLHTEALFEDYIKNAPNGSNVALQPKYQKFHYKDIDNLNNEETNQTNFFSKVITDGNSLFIDRPDEFGGRVGSRINPKESQIFQMQYKTPQLSNDIRVSYNSSKYPWLESVYRFEIVTLNPSQPDTANFYIPGRSGPGRYIVHYYWRGYRDCTDVDYKTTQVKDVYGIPSNDTRWVRVDHCLFTEIYMVLTHSEIITDPQYCMDNCEKKGDQCIGVNVVPLMAPTSAATFTNENGSAWEHPSVPGADIYAPWSTDKIFNVTRYQFLSKPSPDRFMCYSLIASPVTDTDEQFTLAASPDDPLFYSTCYYKLKGNMFADYLNYSIDQISSTWKFNDRCVDCKSLAKNSWLDVIPNWIVPDTCVNCDREPETYPKPLPAEFNQVDVEARCDGLNGVWQFNTHHTCPNTTECTKMLSLLGRNGNTVTLEECQMLVEGDSECSNTFMFKKVGVTQCYCYKKLDCCLNCSRRIDKNYDTYELKATPDPKCSTGVKSANNDVCCTEDCGVGHCDNHTYTSIVGFCSALTVTRSCNQYGPPCKLN